MRPRLATAAMRGDPLLHRQAGLGSLGRPRVTAVARWLGGFVAREAKPVVPSAWLWAADRDASWQAIHIGQLLSDARRCPDPYLSIASGWLIKRLAPDGARLELTDLPPERDEERLLRAMGTEAGNVHGGLASTRARIAAHLGRLGRRGLREAAHRMMEVTLMAPRPRRRPAGSMACVGSVRSGATL